MHSRVAYVNMYPYSVIQAHLRDFTGNSKFISSFSRYVSIVFHVLSIIRGFLDTSVNNDLYLCRVYIIELGGRAMNSKNNI